MQFVNLMGSVQNALPFLKLKITRSELGSFVL